MNSTYRLKGASGAVSNQTFGLAELTVIGRSAECELRVDLAGIAERHAEISAAGDRGLSIRLLDDSHEIRVNGQPVKQARLHSGDEIRIASCRWVVQAPGLRPEKILTSEATQSRRSLVPWLVVLLLLAAAALALQRGWLPF